MSSGSVPPSEKGRGLWAASSVKRWKPSPALPDHRPRPVAVAGRHRTAGHGPAREDAQFNDRFDVALYSEHLSYTSDDGQLYDLMPIPFTDEAIHHVAARIRQVQDVLGRRIAVENVSYYAAPYQALAEVDFVTAVLAEADTDLLLDVNNVYVNAINHGYDADEFIARMPGERIASYHIAGHYDEDIDLKVDTHGAPVKADVWATAGKRLSPFRRASDAARTRLQFPADAGIAGRNQPHPHACRTPTPTVSACRSCAMHDILREQQFTMARHLRDPERHAPPPGIEERRLRVYRELFFNAIESLLGEQFSGDPRNPGRCRMEDAGARVLRQASRRTPLFPQVAGEFVDYLETHANDDMLRRGCRSSRITNGSSRRCTSATRWCPRTIPQAICSTACPYCRRSRYRWRIAGP